MYFHHCTIGQGPLKWAKKQEQVSTYDHFFNLQNPYIALH